MDLRQSLSDIVDDAKNMSKIIDTFLDISRIETGLFPIHPRVENLPQLIDDNIVSKTEKAKLKNIKIIKSFDTETLKTKIDRKIIDIILDNLLENALKYTPEKGQIEVSITHNNSEIIIKVTDTGFGIPKADQTKVFQKMFRGNNISSPAGSGLGLYMVKMLTEQAGGRIWLKSPIAIDAQQPGTSFFVSFPRTGMNKNQQTDNNSRS